MFGLFRREVPAKCPVPEDKKIWIDKAFALLLELFGKESLVTRKICIPHFNDFPISYNGSEECAYATLRIIANNMEIDMEEIHLDFFDKEKKELRTDNSSWGTTIFIQSENNADGASGLYWGKREDGKYHVSLERSNIKDPERMVATLAHELAHIKLLGENRIEDNDEKLTDLTVLIFGLGIFNANAAFQTYRTSNASGWRSLGYLSQMEWGYALALLAQAREETSPAWTEHLCINVKRDFKMAEKFLQQEASLDSDL